MDLSDLGEPAVDDRGWPAAADSTEPLVLPLPGRPGVASTRAASIPLRVHAGIVRAAQAVEQTTAADTGLAAFVVLLHRLTGRRDLLLDVQDTGPDGARHLRPVCFRLPPDPTWREGLCVVRQTMAAPVVQPEPAEAGAVGRVRYGWLPASLSQRAAAGNGSPFVDAPGGAPPDLELCHGEHDGSLTGAFHYRADRYERRSIRWLAAAIPRLLRQCSMEPDEHMSNLPLLDERQWRQVVREWNDTGTEYPQHASVPELFEQWEARTPDAAAVRCADRELSYRQLDEEANRLAHYLRELGVGVESRVGLCLNDTADWIMGALAALKAGATYVPLDPAYPADRLTYMCRDACIDVVLLTAATASAAEYLQSACGTSIFLDAPNPRLARQPTTRPVGRPHADALAYIMYTSGSTGRPKGVGVTHRNIVRLVRGTDYLELRPDDVVAQAANISFDAATLEAWGPLLNGAQVAGIGRDDLLVPHRLRRALEQHGVTVLFLATSLLRQTALDAPETFAPLRYLTFGGEQADLGALTRVRAHCPHLELVNAYGPTENTTYTTTHRCTDQAGAAVVPIGRPIANTRTYVLDGYLQPVPPGIVGELYAGGDGLARGYLGQPRLTAERFVPDPFATRPGSRLYRTGDLVRQHPDGVLEFVGRVDNQVKVRGFRVEPGEVEECLRDWGLREVVVRADRDVHGDARLVAYVVLDGGHAGSGGKVEALREHARRHLPEYMVPAVFVVLPKLLLNPNGKVDMAALPPPPTGDRGAVADRVAPGTPTERALAAIWRDLLVVPEVFADDDFFDLGGRSLKATRTRTRLSAAIGVDVPLRLVFEHPTLAALAAAADRLAAGGNQAGAGSEEAGDHPAAADGATAPAPASPLSVADLLAHLEQPNARTTG